MRVEPNNSAENLLTEADLRILTDNSNDVILRHGPNLRLQYVSPSSVRLFGWMPREMVGMRTEALIVPEDLPALAASVAATHAGDRENARGRVRALRKDGTTVWIETNPCLIRDAVTGKPGDTVVILRDISKQKSLEDQLSAMARTDGLTGLANRRAFDETLSKEWRRTLREGTQMSLLLFDIDHFKGFNDLYGHRVGDDCLRAVAAAVKGVASRPDDLVARYGGEELAAILPDTDANGAKVLAEEARMAVAALGLPNSSNSEGGGSVTVSVGAATALSRVGGTMKMLEGLLAAADSALYKAKHNGRNCMMATLLLVPNENTVQPSISSGTYH